MNDIFFQKVSTLLGARELFSPERGGFIECLRFVRDLRFTVTSAT